MQHATCSAVPYSKINAPVVRVFLHHVLLVLVLLLLLPPLLLLLMPVLLLLVVGVDFMMR